MTKKIAEDISNGIADAPALHELEEGETVTLRLGYTKGGRFEGVTIGFHFGTGDVEQIEQLHKNVKDSVKPRLDMRKFSISNDNRHGRSWNIGNITVNGKGELVDYNIKDKYLKPTEK